MAFPKKHGFSPGRRKGSINKRSQAFLVVLESKGFNVAEALLEIYDRSIAEADATKKGDTLTRLTALKLAGDMAKEIASYVMPKLKAIEHTQKNSFDEMDSQQKLDAMRQAVSLLEREVKQIPISLEVEQNPVKVEVGGSTPSSGAND